MPKVVVTRRLPFPALERLAAAHEVTTWPGELPPSGAELRELVADADGLLCLLTDRVDGALLDAAHEVTTWPGELPPSGAELRELVADADGLLCLLTDRVDGALLDAAPRLRAVAVYAVGTDNVDAAAARERGVAVGNTPDVLTEATADLAFALILAAARRLPEAAAAVRRPGGWRTWEPAGWLGLELHGATLGIVGAGRIGEAVARRAGGFGLRVLRHRPLPLEEVLAGSDVVSLHVPLTDRTRHLVDARALAAMKPGAILVNTARGGVVDHAALADALGSGHLGAAALDVTDPEPLPPDHPLLHAPNLLVVPHIGSATHATRASMADMAVDNLLAALAGEPMPHPA